MRPLGEIQGFGFQLTAAQLQTVDDGWRGVTTGVPTTVVPSWPPGQEWYYRDPQGINQGPFELSWVRSPIWAEGKLLCRLWQKPDQYQKEVPNTPVPHTLASTPEHIRPVRANSGMRRRGWVACAAEVLAFMGQPRLQRLAPRVAQHSTPQTSGDSQGAPQLPLLGML